LPNPSTRSMFAVRSALFPKETVAGQGSPPMEQFANRIALAAAGLTVTARPLPLLIDPSVTVMLAAPALYSFITPLLEPETEATPLLKLTAVADPKLIAVPELFVTVGLFEPIGVRDRMTWIRRTPT
jgi:hypothetical protein